MYDIELLKFLKESRGASVYDVMQQFGLSRTAALYRIEQVSKLGLIYEYKQGKRNMYMVAEGKALESFFDQQIRALEIDKKELFKEHINQIYKPRSQRLKLAFVNYYDFSPGYKKELEKYYDIQDYSNTQLYISQKEFIKRAKDIDVIVNNYATEFVTEEMIEQLPRLQYMHLSTHMYRYVDISALRNRNIHLSNIPYTYKSIAVAEYILAQTFALLRDTVEASNQVKTGINEFRYFRGEQLRGKKIIIFGTDVGTKDVVETIKSLGVEVSIYTEDMSEDPAVYGVSHFATEEEVFETGDILYVSWTGDEQKGLIGNIDEKFLNKIKRPVYIISVYKHRKIDYKKLRELIYSGLIKGIAFDSYPEISYTGMDEAKKLLYLPNVIVTPDIGWYTQDSVKNMNKFTNERLIAYSQGRDDYLLL